MGERRLTMRIHIQHFRCGSLAVLFAAMAFTANAQTRPWTAAGSTGTVDEADTAEVRFLTGEAQMVPAAPVGTTSVIRYNVVAVDDAATLGVPRLTIRYRTGDNTGRVIARLYRYNFLPGGAASVILTFDSNGFPPTAAGYVTRILMSCSAPGLDFTNNAYFIEVEFRKNGVNGTPALGTLKLERQICQPG
jgi:hypothetical protein